MDVFLKIIYIASVYGCAFLVYLGFKGMTAYGNEYYETSVIPGVAGFTVFPVINTLICIGLGIYVLDRIQKRKKRDAEIKAMMDDPNSFDNRFRKLLEDQHRL